MKRVFLAVILILAPVAIASAEPNHVIWTRTYEEAIEQAKKRGTMIFIAEMVNNDPDNIAQPEVWKDPAFIKASRDFICLFACPHSDTPQITMKIDGEEKKVCAFAPGITRADHLKMWDIVRLKFGHLNTDGTGSMRMPFHFVINADEKVLTTIANGTADGGFAAAPVGSFLEAFATLIRKHGRGLSESAFNECTERLEKAKALHGDGDLSGSLKQIDAILKLSATSKLADEAKEIRAKIVEAGSTRLQAAEEKAGDDPVSAVIELERIFSEFAGTEVAKNAKTVLSKLKRDPRVKSAMRQIAALKSAEKTFTKAEKEIDKENYAKALSLLDGIAKKYPGTGVGDRAKARADGIRADEGIMESIKEQAAAKDCKSWLSMGRTYAKNGMTDKARALFQKVVDKYPGTAYADEAAAELKKLP